jgi:hypothetical protein
VNADDIRELMDQANRDHAKRVAWIREQCSHEFEQFKFMPDMIGKKASATCSICGVTGFATACVHYLRDDSWDARVDLFSEHGEFIGCQTKLFDRVDGEEFEASSKQAIQNVWNQFSQIHDIGAQS